MQIALLSCHSAGTSIILKLKENAAVFSYQKKLDLIRDLKIYFTCLWSLWIWLLLGCRCKITTNIYVFEKDIHMVSFFLSPKLNENYTNMLFFFLIFLFNQTEALIQILKIHWCEKYVVNFSVSDRTSSGLELIIPFQ